LGKYKRGGKSRESQESREEQRVERLPLESADVEARLIPENESLPGQEALRQIVITIRPHVVNIQRSNEVRKNKERKKSGHGRGPPDQQP
jgi:hypothetical protein